MAPALTQASDPPTLADATHDGSPPSTTHDPSTGHIKPQLEIEKFRKTSFPTRTFLSNSEAFPLRLAPPAFGEAEGCPLLGSVSVSNMDEPPTPPQTLSGCSDSFSDSRSSPGGSIPSQSAGMGCHNLQGTSIASATDENKETQPQTTATNNLGIKDLKEILQSLTSHQNQQPQQNQQQIQHHGEPISEEKSILALNKLCKSQKHLEQRRLYLLRRLRRITARGLGVIISTQMKNLVHHGSGILDKEREAMQPSVTSGPEDNQVNEMLYTDNMKNMSTSDLISLVRRVEASQHNQHKHRELIQGPHKLLAHKVSPALPPSLAKEVERVGAEMKVATYSHLQYDSDATESSSGGESCDEGDGYNIMNKSYKPVRERAFYRYCKTRGWIASRWTWLRAQIADIDYMISQQQKLYTHLRESKGRVCVCEDGGNIFDLSTTTVSKEVSHLNIHDTSALTCLGIGGLASPRITPNGYHPPQHRMDDSTTDSSPYSTLPSNYACARTLGVNRVKRRKYVNTSAVLVNSGYGCRAKFDGGGSVSFSGGSSIRNRTSLLRVPCLCASHSTATESSNKNKVRLPLHKYIALNSRRERLQDRIAKYDPAFHPVLSNPSEMLQSECLNHALRNFSWKKNGIASSHDINKSDSKQDNYPVTRRKKREKDEKKLKLESEERERITLRLRKSVIQEEIIKDGDIRDAKRRRINSLSSITTRSRSAEEEEWMVNSGGGCNSESNNSSPCQSPAILDPKLDKHKKQYGGQSQKNKQNLNTSSYDINNIVIPYSMAASTRVQKLEYKEIQTPKWRQCHILPDSSINNNEIDFDESDDDIEDTSDEAYLKRHSRSEEMERKKFLKYLQSHGGTYRALPLRHKRNDSSGTNTPDHPLSPRPYGLSTENSPLPSPSHSPPFAPSEDSNPSTVLTLSLSNIKSSLLRAEADANSNVFNEAVSSSAGSKDLSEGGRASVDGLFPVGIRTRRSCSGGGHDGDKFGRGSEDGMETPVQQVLPYAPRVFPLTDNEYEEMQAANLELSKPLKVRPMGANQGVVMGDTYAVGPDSPAPGVTVAHCSEESQKVPVDAPVVPCNLESKTPIGGTTGGHSGFHPGVETMQTAGERVPLNFVDMKPQSLQEKAKKDTQKECGKRSPSSEGTDSAPDAETEEWASEGGDNAPPDWTISALQDECGRYVLEVHKN